MSGHTEGPWLCQPTDFDGPDYGVGIVGDNLGGLVGYALPWLTEIDSRDYSRVEANARLIAAAPELLEALETFVADDWAWMSDEELAHELSQGNQMIEKYITARSAIAKARGQ